MTRKILVADGDRRLPAILAGHDLALVHTMGDAQRALGRSRFDLVVVAVHFDDSRMFDLLRHVQASGVHAGRPIACVRSQHFISQAISIEGLEIAARALGCTLFLDLTWYPDEAAGNAEVRQRLEALISP